MDYYVVRTEYLDKNKQVIQGECWYEGLSYSCAIDAYCKYCNSYVVDKSQKQYASDIYYDSIVLLRFDISDRVIYDLDDFDFDDFDFDEFIRELDNCGKYVVVGHNGDYYA